MDADTFGVSTTDMTDIMVTINRVYSALVIIVGTIGNVYCVYVIRSTHLRKSSSSQYLLALACSDLGFLVSLSVTWLSGAAGVRWYHLGGVCQVVNYASYVFCFLSAWYIVCLTAERCVVIHRPFYARTMASATRARVIIGIVTVIGLAMNGFILILVDSQPVEQDGLEKSIWESVLDENEKILNGSGDFGIDFGDFSHPSFSKIDRNSRHVNSTVQYLCLERSDTSDLYDVFNTLDMVFSFSVPLMLTFLLNMFICVRLVRASRERKSILASTRKRVSISSSAMTQSPPIPPQFGHGRKEEPNLAYPRREEISLPHPKIEETSFSTNQIRRFSFHATSDQTIRRPLMSTFRRNYDRIRAGSISGTMGSPCLEKERHITLFLVSISLTHLVLNLPSYLYRLIYTVASPGARNGDMESVILSVLYLLFYTQFAVNFILYSCQSGKIRGHIRS